MVENAQESVILMVTRIEGKLDKVSEKLETKLDKVSEDVNELKGDIRQLDGDVKSIKELEIKDVIDEYKPLWNRYKKECENKDKLILGGQQTIINWIIIGLLGLIFAGVLAELVLRLMDKQETQKSSIQITKLYS